MQKVKVQIEGDGRSTIYFGVILHCINFQKKKKLIKKTRASKSQMLRYLHTPDKFSHLWCKIITNFSNKHSFVKYKSFSTLTDTQWTILKKDRKERRIDMYNKIQQ